MTPPPFPNEEARAWLDAAQRDLRLADLALGDVPPMAGEALYHAQQSAEKALKSFLVSRGAQYPLTHDILKLLKCCAPLDAALVTALSSAAGLTQFATRFRYPGEEQPAREEALYWLGLARQVGDEVERRLSPEPR